MVPMLKRNEVERGLTLGPEPREGSAPDVRNRQAAASYLQASTATDDPTTRESLRRRAAALLAPPAAERRPCVAC